MTTPYKLQVRNAAVAALQNAASQGEQNADFAPLAGAGMALARTWPTPTTAPGLAKAKNQLLLYIFREHKEGVAQAGTVPQFKTTLTLVVEPRVEGLETPGKSGGDVEGALDALCQAVETALLTDGNFLALIEQVSAVATELKYDGKGQRVLGNAVMSFDVVYHEVFGAAATVPFGGVNLHVDAINIFDPTGTYTPPFPYTTVPGSPTSPRTKGPEGREEIGAQVNVTQ